MLIVAQIEASVSDSSISSVALAKLQEMAARVDARNAVTNNRKPLEPESYDFEESDPYWMDNYWNKTIRRRAATVGEIYIRRGPPEVDDGVIFDMDL